MDKTLEMFTVIRRAFSWWCDLVSNITVTYSIAQKVVQGKHVCFLSLSMTVSCIRGKKKINSNIIPPLAATNKVYFGNNALVKYILRHLSRYIIFLCKKIKYSSKQDSQVQVFRMVCLYTPVHIYTTTESAPPVILLASSTSLPSALTPSKT